MFYVLKQAVLENMELVPANRDRSRYSSLTRNASVNGFFEPLCFGRRETNNAVRSLSFFKIRDSLEMKNLKDSLWLHQDIVTGITKNGCLLAAGKQSTPEKSVFSYFTVNSGGGGSPRAE